MCSFSGAAGGRRDLCRGSRNAGMQQSSLPVLPQEDRAKATAASHAQRMLEKVERGVVVVWRVACEKIRVSAIVAGEVRGSQ